jgi:hypothetical protein
VTDVYSCTSDVDCDGELLPLSQTKTPIRKGRVLFPEEPEPESEVVAPDPQLSAVGGAGGASSDAAAAARRSSSQPPRRSAEELKAAAASKSRPLRSGEVGAGVGACRRPQLRHRRLTAAARDTFGVFGSDERRRRRCRGRRLGQLNAVHMRCWRAGG